MQLAGPLFGEGGLLDASYGLKLMLNVFQFNACEFRDYLLQTVVLPEG